MAVMRRVSHLPAAAFVLVFSTLGTHAWAADTRLADAAMKRDVATVRKLLDEKVDVNAPGADGTPALHWLVRVGDFDTARRLLRPGADAVKPHPYRGTPMSLACANGNPPMIALLLEPRADANA